MTDNSQNDTFSIPLKLFLFGLILILVGFVLVIVGNTLSAASNSYGVIVILGPIPIVFGKGENVFSILLIAVILTIASIVFFLLIRRQEWKAASVVRSLLFLFGYQIKEYQS